MVVVVLASIAAVSFCIEEYGNAIEHRHFRQPCAVKAYKSGLQVKFKFDYCEVKLRTNPMSAFDETST